MGVSRGYVPFIIRSANSHICMSGSNNGVNCEIVYRRCPSNSRLTILGITPPPSPLPPPRPRALHSGTTSRHWCATKTEKRRSCREGVSGLSSSTTISRSTETAVGAEGAGAGTAVMIVNSTVHRRHRNMGRTVTTTLRVGGPRVGPPPQAAQGGETGEIGGGGRGQYVEWL